MKLTRAFLITTVLVVSGAVACSSAQGPEPNGPDGERDTVATPPDATVVEAQATAEAPPPVPSAAQATSAAVPTPPLPAADGARSVAPTARPGAPAGATGAPPPVVLEGAPSGGISIADSATPTAPPAPPPAAVRGEGRGGGAAHSRSAARARPARPADGRARPRPSREPAPSAAPAGAPAMEEAAEAEAPMAAGAERDDAARAYGGDAYGGGGLSLGTPVTVVEQQRPIQRLLTAATVPDVDQRPQYLGYLSRHPGEAMMLGLDMSRRVRFRILDGGNRPVHDAALTVVGQGFHVQGRTHADGFWDFFPSMSGQQGGGPATVYIQASGQTAQAVVQIPHQGDGRDIYIRLPQAMAANPPVLDLAFLIDVTGSMGDELRYVNEEVIGIVDRVRSAVPQVAVRVGATFYRDRGDMIPIEQIPFSTDVRAFVSRMRYVQATGGGDYPEDVNLGLAAALTTLDWSTTPAVRVLVVIADAPPQRYHDFQYTYHHAMGDASRRGIRILPVAASGADRVVEFLFRAMGMATSTPYVYLTDDSGIGGSHMEADTESVTVEMFSDCLTRLLISDLQGLGMHGPGMPQVGIGGQFQQ